MLELLHLDPRRIELDGYRAWLEGVLHPQTSCTIAVVGKYIRHQDAYKSIYEALSHAGIKHSCKVNVRKIESEDFTVSDPAVLMEGVDGVLVPGGFGMRGVEGKIRAVEYARTHKIPFLGICLGMQCAVIEFARNVLGLKDADSSEFNESTPHPVIDLMDEQRSIHDKGGTMRLGAYDCRLVPGSEAARLYGRDDIRERHRHRYEFNPKYREQLEAAGLRVSGVNPQRGLVEIVEIPDHPFFVGCQFHPEFKSRPMDAHPLFDGLIEAALKGRHHAETL